MEIKDKKSHTEEDNETQATHPRVGTRIDRTPKFNEKKKTNLTKGLKGFQETGEVPFVGIEDED
jgi:hypothetical protein